MNPSAACDPYQPQPYPGARRARPSLAAPARAAEIRMDLAVAVRVENAVKTFGLRPNPLAARPAPAAAAPVAAVAGVSFEVLRGEIFGLVGPNGSGKSTLIRLIATRLAPDAGRISLFGHDTAREPEAAQALVDRESVEAPLFKRLSAVENLLHGARLNGVRAGETRQRVLRVLGRLGLSEAELARPVETLSRGAQQKVAIGHAFLSAPRVLLLDEPTAGLDPRTRREVHAFVRELRDQHGATVLLATHDLAEAEALCNRIAILDHGRVVALDTPAALARRAGATLEEAFLELTA